MKNVQADVLRRVVEMNQQGLKSLEDDRLSQIDEEIKSNSLPHLPKEILSKVFSFLYYSENDGGTEISTVDRILQDVGTPDEWKEFLL